MRDYSQIGREIVEEILREVNDQVGPCFYPGKFKPPHKGHFAAAQFLASDPRVSIVYVIVSNVTKFGITAEDSENIWNQYLKAEPNMKIKVIKSTESTPIKDVFKFASENKDIKSIYVASAKEEAEELGYFKKLQEKFPNVKKIIIPDQFGRISSTDMRKTIMDKNFEKFSTYVPTIAYNKGIAKDMFNMLIKILK
jgi:hypothetical protein